MEHIGKKFSTYINNSHKMLKICKLWLYVGNNVNILIFNEQNCFMECVGMLSICLCAMFGKKWKDLEVDG